MPFNTSMGLTVYCLQINCTGIARLFTHLYENIK